MKVLPWKELHRELRYSTRIFEVYQGRFRSPQGEVERNYDVIHAPDWVNIIALTNNHNVVVLRQFRPGTQEISLEIPGGMIDPGEPPEAAARRELLEETGYASEQWELIGTVTPNPAIFDNHTYTFLARAARSVSQASPDEDELLDAFEMPLQEIPSLLVTGQIQHSLVVAAFAHLAGRGLIELKVSLR